MPAYAEDSDVAADNSYFGRAEAAAPVAETAPGPTYQGTGQPAPTAAIVQAFPQYAKVEEPDEWGYRGADPGKRPASESGHQAFRDPIQEAEEPLGPSTAFDDERDLDAKRMTREAQRQWCDDHAPNELPYLALDLIPGVKVAKVGWEAASAAQKAAKVWNAGAKTAHWVGAGHASSGLGGLLGEEPCDPPPSTVVSPEEVPRNECTDDPDRRTNPVPPTFSRDPRTDPDNPQISGNEPVRLDSDNQPVCW